MQIFQVQPQYLLIIRYGFQIFPSPVIQLSFKGKEEMKLWEISHRKVKNSLIKVSHAAHLLHPFYSPVDVVCSLWRNKKIVHIVISERHTYVSNFVCSHVMILCCVIQVT